MKDPYKVLGVPETADDTEIKKAYRRLAKKYHPDTNADNKEAEQKFKEITDAYEILGSEESRKKYHDSIMHDGGRNSEKSNQKHTKNKQNEHVDARNFEEQFSRFFGFNPKTKEKNKDIKPEDGNTMDTSRLFNSFFKL